MLGVAVAMAITLFISVFRLFVAIAMGACYALAQLLYVVTTLLIPLILTFLALYMALPTIVKRITRPPSSWEKHVDEVFGGVLRVLKRRGRAEDS
jgi:threonine/homoserine/homoserine lactone efflux protein